MITAEDQALQERFEDCSLPFQEWTHRMHIRIAWIYLLQSSYEDALSSIRQGIQRYNAAHGVEEGPRSGYHETTTVAFAQIIRATMDAYEEYCPVSNSEAFCEAHPQLLSRHLLRLFYSPERRGHPDAKHSFLAPDLASLPQIQS